LNVIPTEFIDLLEGGVSVFIGTCNRENHPLAVPGLGASVSKDRREVTVFIHEEWAKGALDNLRDNPEIAVGFSRPIDHVSLQVKGRVTGIVPASEGSRTVPDRYHASYSEQLYMTGVPRNMTKRINVWPASAVTFEVSSLFLQTPGPGAGKQLEGR